MTVTEKIPDTLIRVGTIGAPYGVRGWLKIHSFTDPITNILSYKPWYLGLPDGWRRVELLEGRAHGKGLVAHIEGIPDRDVATQYRSVAIAIERTALPELDQQEVYWADLIGMTVKNTRGVDIGVIDDVFETGANDVLVVTSADRTDATLIPYVLDHYIISVDKRERVMVVDWQLDY